MFQFLIGRIKSLSLGQNRIATYRFQFLIGRIKSLSILCINCCIIWFQFLIGRIKSVVASALIGSIYIVSIPYR